VSNVGIRKPTPITELQLRAIVDAVSATRLAIKKLRFAQCYASEKRMKATLKSVEGALRHAERRPLFTPIVTATR
jgi:hypothetical protein